MERVRDLHSCGIGSQPEGNITPTQQGLFINIIKHEAPNVRPPGQGRILPYHLQQSVREGRQGDHDRQRQNDDCLASARVAPPFRSGQSIASAPQKANMTRHEVAECERSATNVSVARNTALRNRFRLPVRSPCRLASAPIVIASPRTFFWEKNSAEITIFRRGKNNGRGK